MDWKSSIIFLMVISPNCVTWANGQGENSFENFEQLSDTPFYHVKWVVDLESSVVTFEVTAETLGFIGFGFSTNGNMNGGDIVVGGVDDNGVEYFQDYHGIGNEKPIIDAEQNWDLISANQNASYTILNFKRQFDTCDPDDTAITNDQIKMIWSIGKTDTLEYHLTKGMQSVNLLDPPSPPVDVSSFDHWDFVVNATVPTTKDTSYWCTLHESPPLEKKRHIVGFDVILDGTDSLNFTHHIVFHKCIKPGRMSEDDWRAIMTPWLGDPGGECTDPEQPISVLNEYCSIYFYVWAKGGKQLLFPEHVGYPIGDNGERTFFLMEVHYDNPHFDQIGGPIEYKTGVTVFLTKEGQELRKNDAGLLKVDHDTMPNLVYPPNTASFVNVGHCTSHCTNATFPKNGINVFNVLLHSHLSGRKLKLRHFRDDKELPWISYDNNYDFNYQQSRLLREEVVLLPGDHLTQECTCDTTWMDPPSGAFGGLSTRHEMCQAFLLYYPEVKTLHHCGSLNNQIDYIWKVMGIENMTYVNLDSPTVTAPESLAGKPYLEVMNKFVNWTPELVAEFQYRLRFEDQYGFCVSYEESLGDDQLWWFGLTNYPKVSSEYEPPQTCSAAAIFVPQQQLQNLFYFLPFLLFSLVSSCLRVKILKLVPIYMQ